MKAFATIFRAELQEILHARWFLAYLLLFTGGMGAFLAFGLSESTVLGYTGLGRVLMVFVQASMLVLPIFVLVTTARTLVSDRESGVWEYVLSWPLSLGAYYWGKLAGRLMALILPLLGAVALAAAMDIVRGSSVPWIPLAWVGGFVVTLATCFVGVAFALSVIASSQEVALGAALFIWLALEALIDVLLLGLLVRQQLSPEFVIGLALLNPLQAFRTATFALFDPELTLLGPISFTILEMFGRQALLAWALIWPITLGAIGALVGGSIFLRKDIAA